MKTNLFLSAILALGLFTSQAQGSDLRNDLKTPFQPMTNPFVGQETQPLNPDLAKDLRNLLSQCVVEKAHLDQGTEVFDGQDLLAECSSFVTARYSRDNKGNEFVDKEVDIHAGDLNLVVLGWDGSDSDGGDEQAIAIYDINGKRLATYPSDYVIGGVLEGLTHALGVNVQAVILH
jgi:hypothetical protein